MSDWSWKPEGYGIHDNPEPIKQPKKKPYKAKKKKTKKNKPKKKESPPKSGIDFYKTREWRELRYKVIKEYRSACMACGRTPKDHGIVIHVDHIKPRSENPHMELNQNNLQLLCEDCNLGKSNKDDTDWR